VETSWETDPPRGRPARHRYRLSTAGAELARSDAEPARAGDDAPAPGPAQTQDRLIRRRSRGAAARYGAAPGRTSGYGT
jgi:hypothetical protein